MSTNEYIQIGSDRQLFVDDYLINSMSGVELRLHTPLPAGTAFELSEPWEGVTCDYHTVFKDDNTYRMYYRGSSHEGYTIDELLESGETPVPAHPELMCYAESLDGVTWTKPDLGLIEFEGSTGNNIIWMESTGDMSPFIDGNPDALADQRYKGIVWRRNNVFAVASPDAVSWRLMREEPILTEGPFDSQNVPFWDPWRNEYVIFTRGVIGEGGSFKGGYRWIRRATSNDFLNWSPLELIDTGATPHEHFYTNGTTPYLRAPGIYLSFPRRFLPDRRPREDSPWPGTSDSIFMSSRDGRHWERTFMESFVRPGISPRGWTSRNNLMSSGIVETGETELSMYVLRHRDFPSVHFERVTIRKDGFVSASAGFAGGELATHPLVFEGEELELNYSTSAAGSIKVEVQDEGGNPLPGFALDDYPEMFGDEIEGVARWSRGTGIGSLAGKTMRLRFWLKDADLYAFRFQ